jgi:hypothetical protein
MSRREQLKRRLANPHLRAATAPPTSMALQRSQLARALGLSTFDGQRNMSEALGYPVTLDASKYVARYERGGLAKRIVEALPYSTWRGGGEVIEDEDPDTETEFEKQFAELNKRLKLWPTFQKADVLAGLGEYAGILLFAPGELSDPLVRCNPDDLVHVQPVAQINLTFGELESDNKSPRFNLPNYFNLTLRAGQGGKNFTGKVHYTRIIPVVDGSLDNPLIGTPRLRAVWNYLEDLDKVVGGGAEAYWKRADRGLHIKLDPEIEPDPEQITELQASISEYTHQLKRVITTRGVDVESLGSDVSNFNTSADAITALISATIGIPQRILMGSERGELASSSDQSNYDDRVQDRRESFAGPDVVRPFIDRMMELGVLPQTEEYEVRWPEVDDLNDDQKMKLALDAAKVNQAAGETVIEANEIRDRILGFPPLEHLEVDPELEMKKKEQALLLPAPGETVDGEIVDPETDAEETDVKVMSAKRMRLLRLKRNTKRNW